MKWFRKNERDRIAQHHTSLNSNSSTVSSPAAIENGYHHQHKITTTNNNIPKININGRKRSKTPSPTSSSPALSINGGLTPSSSCDSVFSTATIGFAFIPPNQYRPFGELSQVSHAHNTIQKITQQLNLFLCFIARKINSTRSNHRHLSHSITSTSCSQRNRQKPYTSH